MILFTVSSVRGSIYILSAIALSVIIVAGFEFTRITSSPSSLSARQACVPASVKLGSLSDYNRTRADYQQSFNILFEWHIIIPYPNFIGYVTVFILLFILTYFCFL